MTQPIPNAVKYMTPAPHTIEHDQTLTVAHRMMREHHIRHLPVMRDGALVGVVTERDLALIETLRGVMPARERVDQAMSPSPYTISPETPLDEVVSTMAEHRYGSAVVMDNGKVVGVFTTTDALRAFAGLMHTRLTKS